MIELLGKQQTAAAALDTILRGGNIAGNWSETGTGKTLVNLSVARQLRLRPLVVAPLITHSSWRRWAGELGVPLAGIINVEYLRTGKTPWVTHRGDGKTQFQWHLDPATHMVLWDEIHKGCTGKDSITSRMAAMLRPQQIKTILASATPFDSPLSARAIGYLFGLHQWDPVSFYSWCRKHHCYHTAYHSRLVFPRGTEQGKEALEAINREMGNRIVKLRVADLAEYYKHQNVIEPCLVDLTKRDLAEANRIYDELSETIRREKHTNPLVAQLRARQRVELLKVPAMAEMAQSWVEEGCSVFIGLGFRDTAGALVDELRGLGVKPGLLLGGISDPERDKLVAAFNNDDTPVLVATQKAGGTGVSLHQEREDQRPRRSLIGPTYSADDLLQALGRIYRLGLQGSVVQRIVLAANTIEESVYAKLLLKARDIETLTDSDLE